MSRIGRRLIPIPDGVDVSEQGGEVRAKGPKGNLAHRLPRGISVAVEDGSLRVTRRDDRRPTRAMHGLTRALLANMVTGVSSGFVRQLEIVGVGYRADADGGKLRLQVGYSHPVELEIPEGLSVSVERNVSVRIEGIDKHAVGQFAADVRSVRPPEPYKGKGIRYSDERVRRKVGKAAAG